MRSTACRQPQPRRVPRRHARPTAAERRVRARTAAEQRSAVEAVPPLREPLCVAAQLVHPCRLMLPSAGLKVQSKIPSSKNSSRLSRESKKKHTTKTRSKCVKKRQGSGGRMLPTSRGWVGACVFSLEAKGDGQRVLPVRAARAHRVGVVGRQRRERRKQAAILTGPSSSAWLAIKLRRKPVPVMLCVVAPQRTVPRHLF